MHTLWHITIGIYCIDGQINHWANRANIRASRLNIKTLLYWFFMFLGCSLGVKIAKIFHYCV